VGGGPLNSTCSRSTTSSADPSACIRCGVPTAGRPSCDGCAVGVEPAARDVDEWWPKAYRSPEYHAARKVTFERAGARCKRVENGSRCRAPRARRTTSSPLSTARSMDEELFLCDPREPRGSLPGAQPPWWLDSRTSREEGTHANFRPTRLTQIVRRRRVPIDLRRPSVFLVQLT
jgi:hypothetical protein